MVRTAALAILAFAASSAVWASEDKWVFASGTTGSKLMEVCGNNWSFGNYDPCGAYLTGIIDGLGISSRLCPPNVDTAVHQMSEVAYKALKEQPELWHLPASFIIEPAIIKTFGCK